MKKGSFHAFAVITNNAPSQILQKEQISCSVTVFAPQLQVCVYRVVIPTRPPPALQHPVFSQHKTVRSGRKTAFVVNSDVVFVGPTFPNMYILSFPWTAVILISGVWGQCPCVLPCFLPFILERGCEGQAALPSSVFGSLLTSTEVLSVLYRGLLSMFPLQESFFELVPDLHSLFF